MAQVITLLYVVRVTYIKVTAITAFSRQDKERQERENVFVKDG